MSELEKLKTQLGITENEQDSLLTLILEDSTQAISQMTNRTELSKYQSAVRAVAVVMYNKTGREGLSSYSAGSVSVSYEELSVTVKSLLPSRLVSISGRVFEDVATEPKE